MLSADALGPDFENAGLGPFAEVDEDLGQGEVKPTLACVRFVADWDTLQDLVDFEEELGGCRRAAAAPRPDACPGAD